jgi:hypothetical protein
MYKSLMGVAAAAMLAAVATPVNAAAIRHAPAIAEHQSNVDLVQHRRWNRRHWRGHARYGRYWGPRRHDGYYARPYAYAPYPYYRRYYAPGPYVQFGPFGFGVW